ncbi:MAG: MerR family transcriptional regulator [Candidatus Anoxymicrobium japonicum]|uniref:MerR family transcriptional regulator n=1 Tax=Candidatus Anoxymicrobium japonicum TaxID=2013648 RepID=A0A2N3G3V6_9ACTN|nr:MAG: MerR family transcriptional regulator [Candidatus Anoxymicrobium japonicum]
MEKDRRQGVYVISVAARLAEMHPQTLRMYERRGLLHPERAFNNRRRYSDDDLMRLRRIQELTSEGLNLSGVVRVLAMEKEMRVLKDKMANMEVEMTEAHRVMRQEILDIKSRIALRVKPVASIVQVKKVSRERPGR